MILDAIERSGRLLRASQAGHITHVATLMVAEDVYRALHRIPTVAHTLGQASIEIRLHALLAPGCVIPLDQDGNMIELPKGGAKEERQHE